MRDRQVTPNQRSVCKQKITVGSESHGLKTKGEGWWDGNQENVSWIENPRKTSETFVMNVPSKTLIQIIGFISWGLRNGCVDRLLRKCCGLWFSGSCCCRFSKMPRSELRLLSTTPRSVMMISIWYIVCYGFDLNSVVWWTQPAPRAVMVKSIRCSVLYDQHHTAVSNGDKDASTPCLGVFRFLAAIS